MSANHDYEQALETIQKLHPAPQVLAKASIKMQDPNVEVYDIVELLKADASLTTDIIRLSNSAFYGFEVECTNLSSAISRVGFREVIRLIGLSIASKLLNQNLKHYGILAEDYWAESVTTALLMEGLALYANDKPQDAYIVGLLHSVGKVVVNQIFESFELTEVWDQKTDLLEWERDQIGFDHCYAGATILKRWNFPDAICNVILNQYRFDEKDEATDTIEFCLFYANKLRERLGLGMSTQTWEMQDFENLLRRFEMSAEDMDDLITAVKESYETIKSNMGFA